MDWFLYDKDLRHERVNLKYKVLNPFHANDLTAQKMKFSIEDFFSKCDQTRRKLWMWSHLLKKSLMENLIFCAVSLSVLHENINKPPVF